MHRSGTFAVIRRHRRWRALLASFAVSSIGDFIYFVTIVVYLIEETGSAGWVAASFIARMAVYSGLGPIGGVLADRFDRRRLMMTLDLARAGLMLAVLAVVLAGGPPVGTLVLVTVTAALGTIYRPAAVTATPLLVAEDDLAAANAAEATVYQLAWFVGPAAGGLIIAVAGIDVAFGVNAAAFAISAALVSRIGDIGSTTTGRPTGIVEGLRSGLSAHRRVPGLVALLWLNGAVLFAFGIEQVVQVLVVTERLGWNADGIGALNAALGAGGLLAAPFVGRLAAHPRAGALLALSGTTMGVTFALLAVTTDPRLAVALAVAEGMSNVAFDVLLITLLQRICPERLLATVFGLQDGAGSLTQLVGTAVAPLAVAGAGLEITIALGGGALVVASVLLVGPLLAISRRAEQERLRLAPTVALLGDLEIFEAAGPITLARLARDARVRELPAGTVVFAEGDPPDDFYVIVDGAVDVSARDIGHIRVMSAGEWFGEIGLLRHIPRTATITAISAVRLLVISGDRFGEALSGGAALPDPVARRITSRLALTHPHLVDPA